MQNTVMKIFLSSDYCITLHISISASKLGSIKIADIWPDILNTVLSPDCMFLLADWWSTQTGSGQARYLDQVRQVVCEEWTLATLGSGHYRAMSTSQHISVHIEAFTTRGVTEGE